MKKMMLILVALVAFATVAAAQPRAIGIRSGYGVELSYQHTLGAANFAEIDLGWWSGGINVAAAYEFTFIPDGPFNVYAGPAVNLGTYSTESASGLSLGAGAQLGMEYNFSFPLQLSLDWRPLLILIPATDFGWNNLALGIRYRF